MHRAVHPGPHGYGAAHYVIIKLKLLGDILTCSGAPMLKICTDKVSPFWWIWVWLQLKLAALIMLI